MSFLVQAQRERVGRKIRSARLQAGLSHDQLGARVGTSRQHLIKLEKGQHLAGVPLLTRIAEETGKSLAWFSSDDDDEESDPVADLYQAFVRFLDHRERAKATA